MKFAVFDAANLFSRAHHVCNGDAFTRAGMALHIIFNSLKKAHRDLQVDHIVVVTEGRSWRYDYYPEYKAKRILARKLLKPQEIEDQEVFREVLKDLIEYFKTQTRMTILNCPIVEGDDLIARWVQLHPDDEHVIISSDSDNLQLLAPNVSIFDGMTNRLIRQNGVFDEDGKPMVFSVAPASGKIKVAGTVEDLTLEHTRKLRNDLREAKKAEAEAAKTLRETEKKAGRGSSLCEVMEKSVTAAKLTTLKAEEAAKQPFEWSIDDEWYRRALFIKIIRGDVGDGIFSAFPGVRYKGSKDKAGIQEAWEDRKDRGYNWNNFMQRRWEKLVEVNGEPQTIEVTVADEYARNELLVDLTKQPAEIKDAMDETIVAAVQKPAVRNVGLHFARFCKKHDLPRIGQEATAHAAYLGAPYLR